LTQADKSEEPWTLVNGLSYQWANRKSKWDHYPTQTL